MKKESDFDIWDKIIIYIHYYTIMVLLDLDCKTKFNRVSFEEFCAGNDRRVSECLVGHYWRFKNEIQL